MHSRDEEEPGVADCPRRHVSEVAGCAGLGVDARYESFLGVSRGDGPPALPNRYRALVLVGAYAGLRWGEAVGLVRGEVDLIRSRITVATTAVEVNGSVTLGHEPKTRRSKRAVPVARSVMASIEEHVERFVEPGPEALMFTGAKGGPLFRGTFGHHIWRPSVESVGLDGFTFHGLRHSFVAILVAAGCNVREVSEWAGHNSVAFTLTRYGGLFPDGSDDAVDRLDALLGVAACVPDVSKTG